MEHPVRTGAYDVLFTLSNEGDSISTMILNTIKALPVDLRLRLINRIVVIGGTSMAPGFIHRYAYRKSDN